MERSSQLRLSSGSGYDDVDLFMFVLVEEATKQFENTLCFHSAYTQQDLRTLIFERRRRSEDAE